MRILLVEDQGELREFVKSSLEAECFVVDSVADADEGSFLARTNHYDLLILDYVLPGTKNGAEICKEVRADGNSVPIIMLTVRSEVENKVDVLNLGADDYMTKPFSFSELLARIKALLRRPRNIKDDVLKIDDLVMNVKKNSVKRGEKEIILTRKEFSLLEFLLRNQGIVLSRGMIMENVWDANADPFSNTIESHILNLRKKIDLPGKTKLIYTISGRGYKIDLSK